MAPPLAFEPNSPLSVSRSRELEQSCPFVAPLAPVLPVLSAPLRRMGTCLERQSATSSLAAEPMGSAPHPEGLLSYGRSFRASNTRLQCLACAGSGTGHSPSPPYPRYRLYPHSSRGECCFGAAVRQHAIKIPRAAYQRRDLQFAPTECGIWPHLGVRWKDGSCFSENGAVSNALNPLHGERKLSKLHECDSNA